MRNSRIEPEATDTTVSTTENTSETATADTSIEKKLTTEQLADREKVNTLNNTIEKSRKQFFLNRIKLGLLLVELKKKHKELFWTVIDTSKVSQKTLERAMILVFKDESVFSQAMSNDGAEKDIAENVELLVIDERVKALDMKALSKILKLTLVKIGVMKNLSDKDWAIAIGASGKASDKPYKEYMAKEAEKAALEKVEADKVKAKQILAEKPTTMDTDTYLDYTQKDKLVSIVKIAELEKDLEFFKDILSKNNLLPKVDSEFSDIPTDGKLNTVSKSESEEA